MEEQIIELYKQKKLSIENLSKEFKIGKNKIKQILLENKILINRRGGQTKHIILDSIIKEFNNYNVKCKKCDKQYNDVENKSGSLTEHIKICSPNIIIPSKYKRSIYKKTSGEYWHHQYFDIIEKQTNDKIKCPICDWESTDLINKTGSLTKHIIKNHGSIDEFIEKNKDYEKYFNKFIEHKNIKNSFDDNENNFILCKICDEAFKTITNTHLKNHNITIDDYKIKYGEDSLLSLTSKVQFINNIKDVSNNFIKRSKGEIEIENFLIENGVNVDVCNKNILSGVELDIFLPEHNIAIEYNGLYWHSEKQGKTKTYHINKTKKCIEKNIHLIHIFSDDWLKKKSIIKNRILNLLKKNENKIPARKCEIVNLSKSEKGEFLNLNHLQGNDKSSIYIGLKYNDKIVSVMTFGKLRNSLGNKNKTENVFELYRFASLNVIGGFSKLLTHFIKNNQPEKIITYADRNWSPCEQMCFYSNIGFNYIGETKPNYTYTKKYEKREHRFNFRKDVLIKLGFDKSKSETQIMIENGYDRIWDTGNLKYEMTLNKKNP